MSIPLMCLHGKDRDNFTHKQVLYTYFMKMLKQLDPFFIDIL